MKTSMDPGQDRARDESASDAVDINAATLDADRRVQERLSLVWRETIVSGESVRATMSVDRPAGEAAEVDGAGPGRLLDARTPVNDNFHLRQQIGKGGVGLIFAACQQSLNREVAVKKLRKLNPRSVEKFLYEAEVTSDLEHPNIIPVYDLRREQVEGGGGPSREIFYAMKRVKGRPWSERQGELSLEENLEILLKVADAVAFAHARGVIHRDLKPENVMLGRFGEVILMDWGLAAAVSGESKAAPAAACAAGTPAYMAPEMALARTDLIGVRSDIYLLGAMLYEIVTGAPPHTGDNLLACLEHAARNRMQPTDRQGELIDIARKAMATLPEQRHASVQEFQAAIRDYMRHHESLRLRDNARACLARATAEGEYDLFAEAVFGLRQARELWPAAPGIEAEIAAAVLDYARLAFNRSDYDLALSLLREEDENHRALRARVLCAQAERNAREQRLRATVRLSLRLLLGLIFLLPVTAGLVLGIAYHRAREAMDRYADQLTRQVAATTRERINAFIASARAGGAMGQELMNRGVVRSRDPNNLEQYFAGFLKQYAGAAMIYYGNEQGDYFLLRRMPDGALATKIMHRVHAGRERGKLLDCAWRWRKPGDPLSTYRVEERKHDAYDPRKRPWYAYWQERSRHPGFSRATAGRPHWTDVYVFHTGGQPGITVSVPVFDSADRFLGVLAADITLLELSRFLRHLHVGRTGKVFIMDARGRLVAAPEEKDLVSKKRDARGALVPHLRELARSGIPEIAALGRADGFQAVLRQAVGSIQRVFFSCRDRRYIATLTPARNRIGSGWIIGVLVAEDDLLGEIKRASRSTLWLIGGLMLAGVFCAFLLAGRMSASLKALLPREHADAPSGT